MSTDGQPAAAPSEPPPPPGAQQRPEVMVGAAFVGGLAVAMLLRRLGGRD